MGTAFIRFVLHLPRASLKQEFPICFMQFLQSLPKSELAIVDMHFSKIWQPFFPPTKCNFAKYFMQHQNSPFQLIISLIVTITDNCNHMGIYKNVDSVPSLPAREYPRKGLDREKKIHIVSLEQIKHIHFFSSKKANLNVSLCFNDC